MEQPRRLLVDCGRLPRLVEAEFAATGRWSLAAPVRLLDRRTGDAPRSPHIRSTLGAGVVRHQTARRLPRVERMDTGLGSRQLENQPAPAHVDVTTLQHVANKTRSASGSC